MTLEVIFNSKKKLRLIESLDKIRVETKKSNLQKVSFDSMAFAIIIQNQIFNENFINYNLKNVI